MINVENLYCCCFILRLDKVRMAIMAITLLLLVKQSMPSLVSPRFSDTMIDPDLQLMLIKVQSLLGLHTIIITVES